MEGKKPKTSYWKLNNTLLIDKQFIGAAKLIIKESWNKANVLKSYGGQWEFMKYKIRRLAIQRGKEIAKAKRKKKRIL